MWTFQWRSWPISLLFLLAAGNESVTVSLTGWEWKPFALWSGSVKWSDLSIPMQYILWSHKMINIVVLFSAVTTKALNMQACLQPLATISVCISYRSNYAACALGSMGSPWRPPWLPPHLLPHLFGLVAGCLGFYRHSTFDSCRCVTVITSFLGAGAKREELHQKTCRRKSTNCLTGYVPINRAIPFNTWLSHCSFHMYTSSVWF